jgi:hypothetical protein
MILKWWYVSGVWYSDWTSKATGPSTMDLLGWAKWRGRICIRGDDVLNRMNYPIIRVAYLGFLIFYCILFCRLLWIKVKVTGRGDPYGCETSRLPHFL